MKQININTQATTQRGQSLVEVSLFLPLFLLLIAGIVEVGQLLVTTNRVLTASNASTRFGASGGENSGMAVVALRSITETLPPDENLWDVWAIRGQVNELGTAIDDTTWEFSHIYGISMTQDFSTIDEAALKLAVYEELQKDAAGNLDQSIAADTRFVGTLAMHDADSILGLEFFLEDVYSVDALTVMRAFPSNPVTNGCSAFPIALEIGVRSVTSSTYPLTSTFEFPAPPNAPELAFDFPTNSPDTPLDGASPGDVFKINYGPGPQTFEWMHWNQNNAQTAVALAASLTWPGNSQNYSGSPPAGFIEYNEPTDDTIHQTDRVMRYTGPIDSPEIDAALQDAVTKERTMRFLVYDVAENPSTEPYYRPSGFVVMRIRGYNISTSPAGSWILAEFVSEDTSCGQSDGI